MNTEIIKIDSANIDMDKLRHAAVVLKEGGLVAFPTETVYGLGANALMGDSVANIFKAKGRPSDNPLIVHICDKGMLAPLVLEIPEYAGRIADSFWPGPITLVLKKSSVVPDIATAGLNTVAVRMPSHPVALALICEAGVPVAAPSANVSGRPSPTKAGHVIADLYGKVDIIIDAGSSNVGLESTVLDISSTPPAILRPGAVTLEQLERLLGRVDIDKAVLQKPSGNVKPRAPGMKYIHYSPEADVVIVDGELDKVVAGIRRLSEDYAGKGKKVGILATDQTMNLYGGYEVITMGDRSHPETIASNLFASLREFDRRHVDVILAEAVDNHGIGMAVMNRMNKAAGYNIIKV